MKWQSAWQALAQGRVLLGPKLTHTCVDVQAHTHTLLPHASASWTCRSLSGDGDSWGKGAEPTEINSEQTPLLDLHEPPFPHLSNVGKAGAPCLGLK